MISVIVNSAGKQIDSLKLPVSVETKPMASRGRRFGKPAGFKKEEEAKDGVHPSILRQARKSGQLNISGRSLTTVPDSVWKINIDVPEEGKTVSMDDADDRWWEQTDLVKLILASNWLQSLSEAIAQLPALTVLDVHDNRLENLPNALASLQNLQRLDASRNRLTEFPACVCNVGNLLSLHLEHNQLQKIPENIANLIYLEDLDISNNALTELPRGLGYLCRVVKLNIANNKLRYLPPEIASMNALRQLDCTHNELSQVPSELAQLIKLEQLYLRHNRLTHLPVLTNCAALKELHLGNNQIREITAQHLEHLPALSVLDMRDNKISVLPDEITLLQHLERLDLTNNDLSGLPFVLGTINSLKSVVLDGNPMKSIRRDIITRGTMELKKYLRSRIEEPTQVVKPSGGVQSSTGQSGIIAGTGDGINAHDVCQFKSLDYSNRKVSELPPDVWEVAAKGEVTSVNFSKNVFTELPSNLMLVAEHLKELNLGFNKLSSISDDIGLYLKLTMLDLRNNSVSDLPGEMKSLQSLREIILSCNRLTRLPPVLYELEKLEIIFANDNKIDSIDAAGLKRLSVLATLDLQNNSISQVPPELGLCTQIKSLQLGGNLFRNPRPAILAKGTLALLEHLRSRIVS